MSKDGGPVSVKEQAKQGQSRSTCNATMVREKSRCAGSDLETLLRPTRQSVMLSHSGTRGGADILLHASAPHALSATRGRSIVIAIIADKLAMHINALLQGHLGRVLAVMMKNGVEVVSMWIGWCLGSSGCAFSERRPPLDLDSPAGQSPRARGAASGTHLCKRRTLWRRRAGQKIFLGGPPVVRTATPQ